MMFFSFLALPCYLSELRKKKCRSVEGAARSRWRVRVSYLDDITNGLCVAKHEDGTWEMEEKLNVKCRAGEKSKRERERGD